MKRGFYMKLKNGLFMVISAFMMFSLVAGCANAGNIGNTGKNTNASNNSNASPSNQKLDPVTLKIMFWGTRPSNMDKVIQEAERRMSDTLNVKLDVVFVPAMDYSQKSQMTLAAGESVDLIWDSPLMHMNQMIASGSFEPLDELLQSYGPNILATRPKEMLDGNKVDGVTYGVPLGWAHMLGSTYLIRQDIREKLGIAPIKTYGDLIKFAYAVKENEPSIIPLLPARGSVLTEAAFRTKWDYDTNIRKTQALESPILYRKNNDARVYNLLEEMEPSVWNWIENARTLYEDKIIHPDALVINNTEEEFKKGKIAITLVNNFGIKDHFSKAIENIGGKVEAVTFYNPAPKENISDFAQWNFVFVPKSSKNKERAIQFLNWTQEKENYDLLAYGIEGENWEAVGDKQFKFTDGGYTLFTYSWIQNPKYERMNAADSDDVKKLNESLMDAGNFERDVLTGFSFHAEPVLNELTKYKTIESQYYGPIFNGVVDPDEYWAKFKNEAGPSLKVIQDEYQKQIDEFLAEN